MNIVNVYFRLNVITVIHFLIAFTGILLLVYALLIFYYHRIWDQIPISQLSGDAFPRHLRSDASFPRNMSCGLGNHSGQE